MSDKNMFTLRKALNKAFLKMKPLRSDITLFKNNLVQLLNDCNESESEEFHKNLLSRFLSSTYYSEKHFINTKGRNDLVIHNGKDAKSPVAVIVETKKPGNKTEMLRPDNINAKALQELVLYYLRERITGNNPELKNLIATDIYEWYIFDAQLFEKLFAHDKKLVQLFKDFETGRLGGNKTEFFYNVVAKPAIEDVKDSITFTYFSISDYEKPLRNPEITDDNKLIVLQKIFSPEHLLKKPFLNDSNSLNKAFYNELLHIIGLTEIKDGSKKIITRKNESERDAGSLLENAVSQIDNLDKLSYIPNLSRFGDSNEERLFNLGLELCITWINRVLFLKLLEAQMMSYHKGNAEFRFLSIDKISSFDELNQLFFSVLAKIPAERNERVKACFAKVPYLNSSLFETSEIEQQSVFISNLNDEEPLSLMSNSVLRRNEKYSKTKELNALEYLFEFLDAYDFSSEGSGEIQEDNKNLINASVLGLIFEKINGYRDGSFFTPGFITMYMCHETIRRAVVQKFNETKGWSCNNLDELYNKIDDSAEANRIVNSLKICDPAVGSGHFLVSALNELISVKSDLRILCDRDGRRLKEYNVEIQNDELILTDEDGDIFEYKPGNKESQRVQEALFHEKQTLIENCLFGVDINPNSVKICRLRLWIELLKNAYYKNETELETLPNIDINIKCGNSLISRYALDADIKQALNQSKRWTIDGYRIAVDTYRNAQSKEQKKEMERLISDIKSDFSSKIESPFTRKISDVRGKVDILSEKILNLKTFGANIDKKLLNEHKVAVSKLAQLETEREVILNNKIYDNAFEWRFEFPEVLNDDGDFVGFDVVIGNPPYVQLQKMGTISDDLKKLNFETFEKTGDLYSLFYEQGYNVLAERGLLTFITSNKWMRAGYGESTRKFFAEKTNPVLLIDFAGQKIFDEATVDTNILIITKEKNQKKTLTCIAKENALNNLSVFVRQEGLECDYSGKESWTILSPIEQSIKKKIEAVGTPLKDWDINIYRGILTGYNEAFIIDGDTKNRLIEEDPKSVEIIRPILRGRDIKRYGYDFSDLWIIFIPWHFPLHNDPTITGASDRAEIAFKLGFPAIYNHLLKYKFELSNRNKAETGIRYEWYALQRWGANYWEDFSKQKIIFQEMVQEPSFILDEKGKYMCLDTARIITGENLNVLLSVMNSRLFFYSIKTFYGGGGLGDAGVRMKHTFFEKFPMPNFSNIEKEKLEILVSNPTSINIDEIDNIIYSLYQLDENEIVFIKDFQRI